MPAGITGNVQNCKNIKLVEKDNLYEPDPSYLAVQWGHVSE